MATVGFPRLLPLLPLLPMMLLLLALAACGGRQDAAPAPAPRPAPAPVDPATLEIDAVIAPEPAAAAPAAAWQPPITAIGKAQWRSSLREAAAALEAARLESDGEQPGALDLYLGVLLAQPGHVEAAAGLERSLAALLAQASAALPEGRIAQAERNAAIVLRLRPDHAELPVLAARIEQAHRADGLVQKAEAHLRAGRVLLPEGRNAVAAYREALAQQPDFLPATAGLARLQAARLDRALQEAQAGTYEAAEQWLEQARLILPDAGPLQDMSARIVELRQARTEALLVQAGVAVDGLDLELAERRLQEARRVSLQSQGLDALAERIELARHYGRYAPRQVFRDALAQGGEGPELVVIAHGAFQMGSPDDEPHRQDNEGPIHEVRFERGYALARAETSVAEFRRFVEASRYRSLASQRGGSTVYDEKGGAMVEHAGVDWQRDHAGRTAAEDFPVVHVAFEDAEAYVGWLSAQTGQRYRLPSEAEFEHALRADSAARFPWGDQPPLTVLANLTGDGDRSRSGRRWANAIRGYNDGHWGPAPVRSYPVEGFASYDLLGNVSEWVQDCWHDSYRRAPQDGSAWVNAGCEERVLRGASWASSLERARSAARQAAPAGLSHARVGFRVVREL